MAAKPSRAAIERDRRIGDLIDEVQSYSNPTNAIPTPPRDHFYPPFDVSGAEAFPVADRPNGRQPFEGFEPREHPWDEDVPWDGGGIDLPVIDGEIDIGDKSASEGQISATGADALAFYAPFHFYGRYHWGIYIRDYGLAYLASAFKRSIGQSAKLYPADSWMLQAGWEFLLQHEYFHFLTEVAASQVEAITRHRTLYEEYFFDPVGGTLEEALANARGHSRLSAEHPVIPGSDGKRFQAFLEDWMKTQPRGYRDFGNWTGRKTETGKGLLATRMLQIVEHARTGSPKLLIEPLAVRPYQGSEYSRVPVVRVHDSRVPWIKIARFFPNEGGVEVSVHSLEHPPPHIHVKFDGEKEVRLQWDELLPLSDERPLSGKERKRLDKYLGERRRAIDDKVQRVFSSTDPSKRLAPPRGGRNRTGR
jgi:hypothetical protein